MDPNEAWLRDEIDDTHYFPDENGQFNLQEEAISSFTTLIVEGPTISSTTATGTAPSTSSRCTTAGGVHGPSSSLSSTSPTFRSVTAAHKKAYNIKIIRASMISTTGRAANFKILGQTFLEIVDSTANLEYVEAIVQKRWGSEYVIVTNDGLKLEDSPATQGIHRHPISACMPKGLTCIMLYTRVRNPKNQLLQINPPTIVGCSL